MTVTRHEYVARMPSGAGVRIQSGEIVLDATRAPHVGASCKLPIPGSWRTVNIPNPLVAGATVPAPRWTPDLAALEALDPRRAPRVRITAGDGRAQRVFNLGVRQRDVDHATGVVDLELASDEALLSDYAPMADDHAVWVGSVGHVVQYVLGMAGMPANLEPNPRALPVPMSAAAYLTRWGWTGPTMQQIWQPEHNTPGGTNITTSCRFQSNETTTGAGRGMDSYGNMELPTPGTTGHWLESPIVTPGDTIAVSRHVRWVGMDPSAVVCNVRFHNGAGQWVGGAYTVGTTLSTGPGRWHRVGGVITVPAGAVRMVAQVRVAACPITPASILDVTGMQTDLNDEVSEFRDYTLAYYSANAVLPADRDPELLVWRAGQSAMDFLQPIVQAVGLRLVCDERRRWTLRAEDSRAGGQLEVRHGVNLIAGTDSITRDEGAWYDAAIVEYTWTDAAGVQQRAVDSWAATARPSLYRRFARSAPFPGAGFARYAVRRAQGRGRVVTATCVADWTAAAEQAVTVTLDGAPTQTGFTERVSWDIETDRMTVTTRTADTPSGAIVMLPGVINQLPGTIQAL